MINKIRFDNIDEDAIKHLKQPSYINLMKVAIDFSDALIIGSEEIPKELETYLKASNKPVLEYFPLEEFAEPYSEFYNTKVLN
jgi:starch synthase